MAENNLQIRIWEKLSLTMSIIPLKGKKPVENGWQQFCLKKRSFKADEFKDCNAGIACGPASNIIALDIDDLQLFDSICKDKGWLIPDTYQVQTGSGKLHYYFSYPDNGQDYGNKSIKKWGFDIRGLNGQVVAPGSIHPDTGKAYTILKDSIIAPAPDWLLALYDKSKTEIVAAEPIRSWDRNIDSLPIKAETKIKIRKGLQVGQRSEAIMTVLNVLVGVGLKDSDIFSIFESYPIGEKYHEKGSCKSRWLQSQVDKARQYLLNQNRRIGNSFDNEDLIPLDVFGDTSLSGEPGWSAEFVPRVIHDFAEDSASRLGVKTEMIALPALAIAAGAITDKIMVQPKTFDTTWVESPRIWVAVIAEPGQKKTPAINLALKPLKEVEVQFYDEDRILLEEYENQLEQYESEKKRKSGCVINKPKKPPQRRKIVEDFTIEALSDVLVDNADGVICHRDELSGWLGSFDAYRSYKSVGKDRAAWLELYNGGIKFVDRVKKGRARIPNWSACLLGGIQPGPMKRLMGKVDDDGLLQRFIVFYGGLSGEGEDRPPNLSALDAYDQLIKKLSKIQPENEAAIVKLSPIAQDQRQIVNAIAKRLMILPNTSAAFRAHISKWSGLFARLALIYHIVDTTANGQSLIPEFISPKIATKVAKFISDFLLPNAARFYTEIVPENENVIHARWVAGYILSRKLDTISAREIYRSYKSLRGKDQNLIITVMHTLTMMGWAKPIKWIKNANRPSQWRVNPKVHQVFFERAETEKKHREDEMRKIQKAVADLGLRRPPR